MNSLLTSAITFFIQQLPDVTLIDGTDPYSPDPNSFFQRIVDVSIGIGVGAAVLLVGAAAYRMMLSKGEAGQIKDSMEQIQNAILGLILIVVAATVTYIVLNAIGVTGVVNIT
ncbi:MAG: hypothetical protein QY312_02290 [Candidatus Dojkabacteria bacterium]|nr:MAG: hypothetical protein QY312_02290 [Candidatus Dojkabacteria bacterium]